MVRSSQRLIVERQKQGTIPIMAERRVLIADFTMGQISDRFAGRLDSELRQHAAETIVGFVQHPDGGLRRRQGTVFVRHGLGITPATDRLYDANGIPGFAVYQDSDVPWLAFFSSTTHVVADNLTNTSSMAIATTSLEYGHELWTEGMFADPETSIEYVQIRTPDDDVLVNLTSDSLSRPADYDFGVIFQNRHITLEQDTGDLQMSVPLSYVDFTTTATDPSLEATPDFSGVETVKWLKARQALYCGTEKAEYEIYSNYGYFNEELGGLMIRKISEVGGSVAAYLGPYLTMIRGNRIVLMQYGGEGFNYAMRSITEQIDNAEWLNIEAVEYGTHRYLIALDRDGDLYCYMDSPGTQVSGWTVLRQSVGWFAIYDKDLYVAYEKSSAYRVDVLPLDSLSFPGTRTARQDQLLDFNDVHGEGGGYVIIDSGGVVSTDVFPASSTMKVWVISSSGSTSTSTMLTDASGALTTSTLKTVVAWTSTPVYAYAYVDGDTPAGKVITLPLSLILGQKARISRVILQVEDTKAAKVRVNSGTWETFTSSSLYSGPLEFRVSHAHGVEPRIEVQPLSDLPLNIYQIMADVSAGEV